MAKKDEQGGTSEADATENATAAEGVELPHPAHEIVNRHAVYAAAGGLIPVPLIELVTSGTIQLRMIAKLCDLYELRFSEQAVKAAIAALVGSALPFTSVGHLTSSLFRAVPVVGPVLGLATLPALAGATTWAIGRVFAWHFASGGTLEDFNVEAKKEQFKREFAEGKRRASEFVRGAKSGGAKPAEA